MISLLFVAVNSALLGRALFLTAISCFWMGCIYTNSMHACTDFTQSPSLHISLDCSQLTTRLYSYDAACCHPELEQCLCSMADLPAGIYIAIKAVTAFMIVRRYRFFLPFPPVSSDATIVPLLQ